MHFTPRHQDAETRFRRLLDDSGLEQPDAMEVAPDELVFFWNEPKVAVVVELDGDRNARVETRPDRRRGPPPG